MNIKNAKFAIIHDWLLENSFGGAEKVTYVIDQLLINNFSEPDIFSLASNINNLNDTFFKDRIIKTSFIQKLPFGKSKVQRYLPFLPFAIEQIDLCKYNVVISSSHAFAKGVLTNPDQLHISYIHTPMRYAWDQMYTYIKQTNFSNYGFDIPIRYLLYKLREWDFCSSQRIDRVISNSNFTAKRVKKYWGLDSKVINPPVDTKRFKYNNTRSDFYLSVNRLVPNKRIDLLITAFNKLGLPLVIIGDGPERLKLEKIANKNITFLKKQSDYKVEEYMSKCRAFVYAGIEDFGIAPIEAMASGAPVIAYGKGGILDSVNCINNCDKDKIATGVLFKKQTSADIFDTINWFQDKKIWKRFNSERLNYSTQKFSTKNFLNKLESFINKAWEEFQMIL